MDIYSKPIDAYEEVDDAWIERTATTLGIHGIARPLFGELLQATSHRAPGLGWALRWEFAKPSVVDGSPFQYGVVARVEEGCSRQKARESILLAFQKFACHEVAEALTLDDARVFDPHVHDVPPRTQMTLSLGEARPT